MPRRFSLPHWPRWRSKRRRAAEIAKLRRKAELAAGAADYEGALVLLDAATALAPRDDPAVLGVMLDRIQLTAFRLDRLGQALTLSDLAIGAFAASRPVWEMKGRILAGLARPVEALSCFATSLRLEPNHAETAYEIAKLLAANGRPGSALRFAERALEWGMIDAELRGLLARLALTLGDFEACLDRLAAAEAQGSLAPHLANLRARALIVRDLACPAPPTGGQPKVRHIAIGGHSYTGSTLLGALLGSLPGCGHAGETGELTERLTPLEGSVSRGNGEAAPFATHCRTCGEACEVFTAEFRESLPRDGRGFYQAVGRRMGVSALVTSDKFVTDFLTKDPAFDFDLIILYKPIAPWLASYVRRQMPDGAPADQRMRLIETWLRSWTMTYEGLLNDIRPTGRVVCVNWEALVARPHAHLARLLRHLDLEGDPEQVFDRIKPGHYVGGNTTASVREVMRTGRIEFRASDAPRLPPSEAALIGQHPRAGRAFQRLERRYRRDFSDLAAAGPPGPLSR